MVSPYTIDIPDERLAAIMAKVEAYDWSQLPDAGGWRSGVGIDDLNRLVTYWQDSYDWRKVERRLNQLPNFVTDLEGERIHFIHVQGNGSKPPLLGYWGATEQKSHIRKFSSDFLVDFRRVAQGA